MNIVCLNPPFKTEYGKFSRTSRSPAVTKSGTIYYPIWLCYAAGSLENSGHQVKVIDSCAERINLAKTIEKIKKFNPDLVLLDTSTPSILSDLESGRLIKESAKNPFIVLMGTHPSSLPDETLRNEKAIDAIIRGEADETICGLADALSSGDYNLLDDKERVKILIKISGISFQVSSHIYHNENRPQSAPQNQ